MTSRETFGFQPIKWRSVTSEFQKVSLCYLDKSTSVHIKYRNIHNGRCRKCGTVAKLARFATECTFELNRDCEVRRSISVILTWVLEYVQIGARPLNSIGNLRVFNLLR